jgi:hypothetical protein
MVLGYAPDLSSSPPRSMGSRIFTLRAIVYTTVFTEFVDSDAAELSDASIRAIHDWIVLDARAKSRRIQLVFLAAWL